MTDRQTLLINKANKKKGCNGGREEADESGGN